jgi:hypothetical protein
MDVYVQGSAPTEPFLGAADLFETEHDLGRPVRVQVRENPDERTWTAHYDTCYQIANHMKDIYADDITLAVAPADKLVSFLESSLAGALADRPAESPDATWQRLTPASDPDITAVNAAFALALCERHNLLDGEHRLYDLAHAAANDAPGVGLDAFKSRFRSLARDPDSSQYRKALVDVTRRYALHSDRAAD